MERAPNSKTKSNPSSDLEMMCFKLNSVFQVENLHLTIYWIKTSWAPGQTWPLFFLENTPILLFLWVNTGKKKKSNWYPPTTDTGKQQYTTLEKKMHHTRLENIQWLPFPYITTYWNESILKCYSRWIFFSSHLQ